MSAKNDRRLTDMIAVMAIVNALVRDAGIGEREAFRLTAQWLRGKQAAAWAEGYAANMPARMVGPDMMGAYHPPRNHYDNSTPEEE